MAFRQQRQIQYQFPNQQPEPILTPSPNQRKRSLEESQEWVLFSPVAAASTTRTHTTSTERTPKTAGRSRISDFGSLDTAAQSEGRDEDDDVTCQGTEIDEDENEELDSLDDGLHAFHEQPETSIPAQRLNQSGSVLPTHDGLGGFRGSATPMQEQLWQYERYNPRRRHARRRSSVQKRLDAMEGMDEANPENEKNERIERWRMEQSRALLEEIERETRRQRRMSRTSNTRSSAEAIEEDTASMCGPTMEDVLTRPDSNNEPAPQIGKESFWQRFTRRVIQDIIGIDENLLSVILGETLAEGTARVHVPSQPASEIASAQELVPLPDSSWDHRFLQRIARELGILVHHISEHPGAFSTYLRAQDTPAYAGLAQSTNVEQSVAITAPSIEANQASSSNPSIVPFAPTLQQPNHSVDPSIWGIETDADASAPGIARPTHLPNIAEEPSNLSTAAVAQERAYWEQELDIKMVFNYLRKRFSSRPVSPGPDEPKEKSRRRDSGFDGSTADISVSPESRKRAALIRRHHPLTSRSAAAERGGPSTSRRSEILHRHHLHHHNLAYNHGGLAGVSGLKRPGSSSCASQSTRSKKSLSRISGGSSRNYWDLGGSIGSAGIGSDAGVA